MVLNPKNNSGFGDIASLPQLQGLAMRQPSFANLGAMQVAGNLPQPERYDHALFRFEPVIKPPRQFVDKRAEKPTLLWRHAEHLPHRESVHSIQPAQERCSHRLVQLVMPLQNFYLICVPTGESDETSGGRDGRERN